MQECKIMLQQLNVVGGLCESMLMLKRKVDILSISCEPGQTEACLDD